MKKFSRFSQKVNIFLLSFLLVFGMVFYCPVDVQASSGKFEDIGGTIIFRDIGYDLGASGIYASGGSCQYTRFMSLNYVFQLVIGFDSAEYLNQKVYFDYSFCYKVGTNATYDGSSVCRLYGTGQDSSDGAGYSDLTFSSNDIYGYTGEYANFDHGFRITGSFVPTVPSSYVIVQFTFNPGFSLKSGSDTTLFVQNFNNRIYYELPDLTTDDHMANIDKQTKETNEKLDNLTNGFQNDGMDSSKSDLDSSLADIEGAEGSLFNPAKSQLDTYEFTDISAMQGVVTGVGFVSTFLQSFYTSSGGLDGLGIITAVGFSVMLVSIVIGLYRHFTK